MFVSGIISIRRHYGRGERFGIKESIVKFMVALPPLFLIIIVLGGILAGFFTATEASAIAVVYAFILSVFVYREVKFDQLPKYSCNVVLRPLLLCCL